MTITTKMSGWSITDIDNIEPEDDWVTYEKFFSYPANVREAIRTSYRMAISPNLCTMLDTDDAYKLAIYLHHPEELAQLKAQFGDNWYNYYLRFNH